MLSKDNLRADLQSRREALVRQRNSSDLQLSSEVWDLLRRALANRDMIAGYAPLRGEPDVLPLLARLGDGKRLGLPFLENAAGVMGFRAWAPGDPFEKSPFGFRQPGASAPLFIPDAILVPLVGFDRDLNRLGHGKGHYDRALMQLPRALKIGIAWSVQEVPAVPTEAWDVPLDAVLTEREWIVRS